MRTHVYPFVCLSVCYGIEGLLVAYCFIYRIYSISATTKIEYLGCFKEKNENSDLNGVHSQLIDNTPKKCILYCYMKGKGKKKIYNCFLLVVYTSGSRTYSKSKCFNILKKVVDLFNFIKKTNKNLFPVFLKIKYGFSFRMHFRFILCIKSF